jgi:hypothetical protein
MLLTARARLSSILENWLHGMYVLVAGFILFLIYNFLYCMHSIFQCVTEGVFDVHKYDSFGLERLICVCTGSSGLVSIKYKNPLDTQKCSSLVSIWGMDG